MPYRFEDSCRRFGAVCMEQSRNPYRILVGKHDSKRQLGRPRWIWEDNIKFKL